MAKKSAVKEPVKEPAKAPAKAAAPAAKAPAKAAAPVGTVRVQDVRRQFAGEILSYLLSRSLISASAVTQVHAAIEESARTGKRLR